MQVQVKNIKGQTVRNIDLPDDIFAVPMNEHVLHLAVKAYQANRRQGTHATKTKAFVSGGGRKPFKQKGTGEARQGSSRSPLMPGGGKAHGPQPRCYRQKVNRAAKLLALKVALSDKARHDRVIVVDDFALSGYSTKGMVATLENLKVARPLLLDERKDNYLYKSAANIPYTDSVSAAEVNAEHVLRHDSFVISVDALTALQQRFGGGEK